jgi:hypothetical protein
LPKSCTQSWQSGNQVPGDDGIGNACSDAKGDAVGHRAENMRKAIKRAQRDRPIALHVSPGKMSDGFSFPSLPKIVKLVQSPRRWNALVGVATGRPSSWKEPCPFPGSPASFRCRRRRTRGPTPSSSAASCSTGTRPRLRPSWSGTRRACGPSAAGGCGVRPTWTTPPRRRSSSSSNARTPSGTVRPSAGGCYGRPTSSPGG